MATACYLMANPHSNMIGIYDLPIEYICIDTALSAEVVREVLKLLEEEKFAFYDHQATTIYIPTYAAIQVAPALSPKDKRLPAIQREVDKTTHLEFKNCFLALYGKVFHLSPIEGASGDAEGSSEGHGRGIGGASGSSEELSPVHNQAPSKGHLRGLVPVPVQVPVYALQEEVKRGLGREGERKPVSRAQQFFESWPEHVINQQKKVH